MDERRGDVDVDQTSSAVFKRGVPGTRVRELFAVDKPQALKRAWGFMMGLSIGTKPPFHRDQASQLPAQFVGSKDLRRRLKFVEFAYMPIPLRRRAKAINRGRTARAATAPGAGSCLAPRPRNFSLHRGCETCSLTMEYPLQGSATAAKHTQHTAMVMPGEAGIPQTKTNCKSYSRPNATAVKNRV